MRGKLSKLSSRKPPHEFLPGRMGVQARERKRTINESFREPDRSFNPGTLVASVFAIILHRAGRRVVHSNHSRYQARLLWNKSSIIISFFLLLKKRDAYSPFRRFSACFQARETPGIFILEIANSSRGDSGVSAVSFLTS